jgi:radical SAM superfamily enzyme YgiQ (UPF0313 family)
MRYLVVAQPIEQYENKENYCMPLGIAYINGALRNAGYDVQGINMMFVEGDPYEELFCKIRKEHIDVLLCGGLTSEYPVLKRIYQLAKSANPDIITIGGGGGFTSEPIVFCELTGVDFAVIGEGELTDCELAEALEHNQDYSKIPGIVYRKGERYIQTKSRKLIEDIDKLPFPSYEGLGMEEYLENQTVDGWYNYFTYYSDAPRLMPMMMSRSCPYHCSFCFHPMGNGYRARSLNNFFEELDMWIEKYCINGIALIDECFSMNPQTVIEFSRQMKPYHIAWACQMRAEIYSEEMLREMRDSGCIGACFGVESMSQEVLENMHKHLKTSTIENALKISYQCGVGAGGNLIFGSEVETFDTVYESIQWNRRHIGLYKHQPINSFTYIQTYPGSRYYENAYKRELFTDKGEFIKSAKWMLNITPMTDKEYAIVGEVARLLQHETRDPGKLIQVREQKDGKLTVVFECPHCHKENTYHNLSRRHLREGRIRNLGCRGCNGLAEYLIRKEDFPFDHYRIAEWMIEHYEIEGLNEYFLAQGWKKIGILGATLYAEKFLEELQEEHVLVTWILRRKKKQQFRGDYRFVDTMLEVEEMGLDYDAIIDAELVHPRWKRDMLTGIGNIPVISLERIIRDCKKEM